MEAIHEKHSMSSAPLVQGKAARRVAAVQGETFTTAIAVRHAANHQATGAQLDSEDDQLRDELADVLTVAYALARRERAYQTMAKLTRAMAIVRRQCELDPSIDLHLIQEAGAAIQAASASTYRANGIVEEILTGRPMCGATRPAMQVPESLHLREFWARQIARGDAAADRLTAFDCGWGDRPHHHIGHLTRNEP
jgi:hypothetical protein